MNIGEIAERFIRAAEIERASHEHVGPAPLRAQQLPYVHDQADKNGWGKAREQRVIKKGKLIQGDWLDEHEDPLAAERKAFWERIGFMPSAHEISELEALHEWLLSVGNDNERRALLAWARAKVGGKSFRRWCFKVEGIHPNTGRARKDRALARISAILVRNASQHSGSAEIRLLQPTHEISDICATIPEDAGERDCLNSWIADGAFAKILSSEHDDFSWASKRNQARRQREQQRRKQAA
ncbi:hypothetical protein NKI61_19910 [Mesorhizobium sp. M0514]|uniref:hypothetical protein n=1 Tax=Mesorhizobium sp. M0514 TaxID=2956955 RepID=UPI0033354E1B